MSNIYIKPSKRGSLMRIAKKEGEVNSDGKISRNWMEKVKNSEKSSPGLKKKVNFAINAGKWK